MVVRAEIQRFSSFSRSSPEPGLCRIAKMNTAQLIASIDREISNLQRARRLLAGDEPAARRGRPAGKPVKRALSAEARARIAEAQRKRWAKQKKASK